MTTAYRIYISDRAYRSWTWRQLDTDAPVVDDSVEVPPGFHPANRKVFTRDVIDADGIVVQSPVREQATLAGVVQISDDRTFGRKGKRLLYKCIPDDPYLPVFLVPFDVRVGFVKQRCNKYVVFRFDSWHDKHPHGIVVETLGDVSSLEAFYEYQLYCKSLHDSVKRLTEDARKKVQRFPLDTHVRGICARYNCPSVPDDEFVFSIDPMHSLDFDDAMSIREVDGGGWRVSIYIANVVFWLEALDLWNSLTNRVATIYLPDRRRPMLPTVLSDSLCSLQEQEDRFAFVCDFVVDKATGTLQSPLFRHAHVRVAKNFRYEEASLCANADYQSLLALTRRLDATCKDSHDVVSFWMVETNSYCAKHLASRKVGIFRSVASSLSTADPTMANLSEDCRRVIHLWSNNTSGQYKVFDNDLAKLQHDILKRPLYVHMTSPIRRLVDLLNQLVFLGLSLPLSPAAIEFQQTWTGRIDFINSAMRSIRKVQNECDLIYRCTQDPNLLQATHRGVVFDKMERENNVYNYMVYLDSLNLLSRVRSTENVCNFSEVGCKLLLFENEEKTRRKVRFILSRIG